MTMKNHSSMISFGAAFGLFLSAPKVHAQLVSPNGDDQSVSVAPQPNAPNVAPNANNPLTLNFENASISDIASTIAEQGGLSIIVAPDVTGRVRQLSINNLSPEEALNRLATRANLRITRLDPTTFVIATIPAPRAPSTSNNGGNNGNNQNTAPFDARQYGLMRVRYVSPRIMAWWLDPQHNARPIEFSTQRAGALPPFDINGAAPNTNANAGAPNGMNGAANMASSGGFGMAPLPEGVDQIAPAEPQNAVLAYGTPQGLSLLQGLVMALDRPLRTVEVAAQVVEFSNFDVEDLTDFDWEQTPRTGALAAPFVGVGQFAPNELRKLVANRRARILNSPRATSLNGQPAALFATTRALVSLEAEPSPAPARGATVRLRPGLVAVQSSIGLTATPTLNGDGSITLVAQPVVGMMTAQAAATLLPGETLAVRLSLTETRNNTRQVVVFITPRVVG